MAHDQSIIQALSISHLQEETKKAKRHYYSYWGKWFKYGSEWFIAFIFSFFFFNWFLINGIFNENTIVSLKISSSSKTKPFPLTVSLLYLSKIYKVQSRGSAGRWSNQEWFTSVLLAATGRTLLFLLLLAVVVAHHRFSPGAAAPPSLSFSSSLPLFFPAQLDLHLH